jgi:hypothetical protein
VDGNGGAGEDWEHRNKKDRKNEKEIKKRKK